MRKRGGELSTKGNASKLWRSGKRAGPKVGLDCAWRAGRWSVSSEGGGIREAMGRVL